MHCILLSCVGGLVCCVVLSRLVFDLYIILSSVVFSSSFLVLFCLVLSCVVLSRAVLCCVVLSCLVSDAEMALSDDFELLYSEQSSDAGNSLVLTFYCYCRCRCFTSPCLVVVVVLPLSSSLSLSLSLCFLVFYVLVYCSLCGLAPLVLF
jgi:hypothetical protein